MAAGQGSSGGLELLLRRTAEHKHADLLLLFFVTSAFVALLAISAIS